MSDIYRETLKGQAVTRHGPGARHELICDRLHQAVQGCTANLAGTRILERRTAVKLDSATLVCPDLALVTAANGKLWLAAEILDSHDHGADTVVKKQIYEEWKLPRLWMIDPRYDNLEVYHATEYGMMLKGILAGSERLIENLLPGFELAICDLFPGPS